MPCSTKSQEFIDRLYGEIKKEYGDGAICQAADVANEKRAVIPWSPSLDVGLSGGVPEGSWVSISGAPKSGKSSSALSFASNAQKPEHGERPIFYFDVEGRLKRMNLLGIRNLNLEPHMLHVIRSTKEKILSAEDYLKIGTKVLHTYPGCVCIFDSMSALCESAELNTGIGTQTRGGGAKIVSQFCRTVANVVTVNKSIVMGIIHLICNTSGWGASKIERAANAWIYQADIRLEAGAVTRWAVGADKEGNGGKQIGQVIKWNVKCSALGPPGIPVEGRLRYGIGLDKVYEAYVFGTSSGLISKAGSWLTLDYLSRHPHLLGDALPVKFQGGEKVYAALLAHPEWMDALEKEIRLLGAALEVEEAP